MIILKEKKEKLIFFIYFRLGDKNKLKSLTKY
jgi:hypothetical protein